jgi:hypothetical protein
MALWAIAGAAWIAFATQAWMRWVASDSQFRPAAIHGPDRFDGSALAAVRQVCGRDLAVAACLENSPWSSVSAMYEGAPLREGSLVTCEQTRQ